MMIEQLVMTSGTSCVFGIRPVGGTVYVIGPVAMSVNEVTQPTPVANGATGTTTPANRILVPNTIVPRFFATSASSSTTFEIRSPGIFIPNGQRLLIEAVGINAAISGFAVITEYPGNRGD